MANKYRTNGSIDKAVFLMNCLGHEGHPLSLGELSAVSGWPKSTVYGIVFTLRVRGLIAQEESTGKYMLGPGLVELGNSASASQASLS